jgi:hypothetical protein
MAKEPTVEAARAIVSVMRAGSSKDGCDDSWRDKGQLYHLVKASGHLATHIKHVVCNTSDGENHLELALTRLAMALSL